MCFEYFFLVVFLGIKLNKHHYTIKTPGFRSERYKFLLAHRIAIQNHPELWANLGEI